MGGSRFRHVLHTWENWGAWEDVSENIPHIRKPNGRLWKRVSGQVLAKSLEWIHRGEFLNKAEFNIEKGPTSLKDKTFIIDKDGRLKNANEYGQIPRDQNSQKLGDLPYFLKISKIREIVYVSDGAYHKDLQSLGNYIYKAGYKETLLSTDVRLLDI